MSILKDLGRVSTETKGSTNVAILTDSGVTPTSYSPARYCFDAAVTAECQQIFKTKGVTQVKASVFVENSLCQDGSKNVINCAAP